MTIGERLHDPRKRHHESGTVGGGGLTTVGDRCFFMAGSHVGHDCIVGNDVIFANNATLGGHCEIGDFVFFGGLSAVHQFGRIGAGDDRRH